MRLEIYPSDIDTPRADENLGTFFYKSNRYSLGDESISGDPIEWLESQLGVKPQYEYSNRRLDELADEFCEKFVALPVYLYDHSGLSVSTSSFNDRWDSGRVGFIKATNEEIRKWYGVKRVTKKVKQMALNCLEAEIKTLDQYLRGDVYGFRIIDEDENEVDSCGGFYGSDHIESGMFDNIDQELLGITEEELKTLLENIEITYD